MYYLLHDSDNLIPLFCVNGIDNFIYGNMICILSVLFSLHDWTKPIPSMKPLFLLKRLSIMFYNETLGICLNSKALVHRFYFHFDFCNIYHGATFACELIGFSCSLITFIQDLHPRPTKLEGGYTGFTLLYPRPTKLEGGYTVFTLSVCPSVHPSVCRRHGFQSISQVSFGFST